ncbi:MAG TPA: hypothetical protein VLF87_02600 [Patescibacteria group bacterium]|nr:hypothetical protein [Patescibacteria group bacterium]
MTDVNLGLPERDTFYPKEENLGKNCSFWGKTALAGCDFPKMELQGRTSCEGIIDDVCLWVKDGREVVSLTHEQQVEIKTRVPSLGARFSLPPGEII